MAPYKPTKFPGVSYREHSTRRHGVAKDKYFRIRYSKNGTQRGEALGWASEGMTPSKAAEILGRIKENIRTGQSPQSVKEMREAEKQRREDEKKRLMQEITYTDFFENSYLPFGCSDKSADSIHSEKNWFNKWQKPRIGSKPLYKVSQLDLEQIKSDMKKKGLATRSIQYCLATVRQVFNYAAKVAQYTGKNPASGVKIQKVDNKRVAFLSHEQSVLLLDALDKKSQNIYDMALLSLDCGLRAGECFNLDWTCIDFDRRMMFIKDTKSGESRHAFMNDRVEDMLRRRCNVDSEGYVFKNRKGGKMRRISNTFQRTVDDLGFNAGITDRREKIVFHSLRHTFASWLVQNGQSLHKVGKLLGHSSTTMTERYSHLAPDDMRAVIDHMEAVRKEMEKEGDKVISLNRKSVDGH